MLINPRPMDQMIKPPQRLYRYSPVLETMKPDKKEKKVWGMMRPTEGEEWGSDKSRTSSRSVNSQRRTAERIAET